MALWKTQPTLRLFVQQPVRVGDTFTATLEVEAGSPVPVEWIDLTLPDGQAVRGHLACLTPDGWPLFINPAWDHALTVSPLVLDRQLRSGEAARAEARSLFDAAATRALAGTAG